VHRVCGAWQWGRQKGAREMRRCRFYVAMVGEAGSMAPPPPSPLLGGGVCCMEGRRVVGRRKAYVYGVASSFSCLMFSNTCCREPSFHRQRQKGMNLPPPLSGQMNEVFL